MSRFVRSSWRCNDVCSAAQVHRLERDCSSLKPILHWFLCGCRNEVVQRHGTFDGHYSSNRRVSYRWRSLVCVKRVQQESSACRARFPVSLLSTPQATSKNNGKLKLKQRGTEAQAHGGPTQTSLTLVMLQLCYRTYFILLQMVLDECGQRRSTRISTGNVVCFCAPRKTFYILEVRSCKVK